jgi:hypothetical protein
VHHLLGQHEVRVVVAALAAVLLGIREAEEAELAHPREDGVREGGLLPLLRVRRELLRHEGADRLAELVVVLGEDEVLSARAVVRLEECVCGRHAKESTVPA